MKTIKYFLTAIVALLVLNACRSDDDEIIVQKTKLTINLTTPEDVEITSYENVKVRFKELATNIITEKKITGKSITVDLRQGKYNISVNGNISYTFNGESKKGSVNYSIEQVNLAKNTETKDFLLGISSTQEQGNGQINNTYLTLNLKAPKGIEITEYKDVKVTFKEINTNVETVKDFMGEPLKLELNQGSYEISVNGMVTYTFEGETQESNIGAFESQVSLINNSEIKDIQLSLSSSTQNDFIFGEIFFARTHTPENQDYVDDDYFKIHNNTNKVLYADGLIIAQSLFETDNKQTYDPDVMNVAFTADAMIQIPGNGTDYPIQPGESFIVANQAINHKENNPNSFDLSKANFEYYYEDLDDRDNPAVPNVINFVDKMVVSRQGTKSFVIFRLPKGLTKEQYLTEYNYNPHLIFGDYDIPQLQDYYKVPNEWIVDAVNFSNQDDFQWIITDPSLDKGYASVGYNSYSSYGRSAKRKVIQDLNGKQFLQDTNNSSVDFEESDPSVANN